MDTYFDVEESSNYSENDESNYQSEDDSYGDAQYGYCDDFYQDDFDYLESVVGWSIRVYIVLSFYDETIVYENNLYTSRTLWARVVLVIVIVRS